MQLKMSMNKEIRTIPIKNFLIVFLMTFWFDSHSGHPASYNEIKTLGANCPPFDTCTLNRTLAEDNLLQQTCECKPSCRRYGTCCVDAPNNIAPITRKVKTSRKVSYQESCQTLVGTQKAIFVISKCKESKKQDEEIKSLCEHTVQKFKDPIAVLPVTNPTTSTTYRNYYCALCNDDFQDLVFWNIRITKRENSTQNENKDETDEVIEDLIYDNTTDQWGSATNVERKARHYFIPETTTGGTVETAETFQPVSMAFDYPSVLNNSITKCVKDLVSDCHPHWKDEAVRNKCHSYMGIVYSQSNTSSVKQQQFRNVHCAICNFAGNKSNVRCRHDEEDVKVGIGGASLSFSWLLDVNLSHGDKVGEISRCGTGELYDPFFKKCRILRCIKPDYKVRNGKCEPP